MTGLILALLKMDGDELTLLGVAYVRAKLYAVLDVKVVGDGAAIARRSASLEMLETAILELIRREMCEIRDVPLGCEKRRSGRSDSGPARRRIGTVLPDSRVGMWKGMLVKAENA